MVVIDPVGWPGQRCRALEMEKILKEARLENLEVVDLEKMMVAVKWEVYHGGYCPTADAGA